MGPSRSGTHRGAAAPAWWAKQGHPTIGLRGCTMARLGRSGCAAAAACSLAGQSAAWGQSGGSAMAGQQQCSGPRDNIFFLFLKGDFLRVQKFPMKTFPRIFCQNRRALLISLEVFPYQFSYGNFCPRVFNHFPGVLILGNRQILVVIQSNPRSTKNSSARAQCYLPRYDTEAEPGCVAWHDRRRGAEPVAQACHTRFLNKTECITICMLKSSFIHIVMS